MSLENSKALSAILASPPDISAKNRKSFSLILIFDFPNPLSLFFKALCKIRKISSVESFSKIKTRDRERTALFTSKLGFSVVAPIKIIVPFSI